MKLARDRQERRARSPSVAATARRHGRAGDVLMLVRQRGALFEAIIRALKNEGVPVAGADRLVLTEHIAVMDLMALADALLLPQDDLALATVLKSPLFGLDEDELFALAWGRRAACARRCGRAGETVSRARLDALRRTGARQDAVRVLSRPARRRRRAAAIAGRLGHEAADALDEFLDLALDYERRETPSLQGFVAWLRSAEAEVKRDMEMARDEVRVMTVHGAKGLEAPIVILADTTTPPPGPGCTAAAAAAAARECAPGRAELDRVGRPKDDDVAHRRCARRRATRSRERISAAPLCGDDAGRRPADGVRRTPSKAPEGCWYDLVVRALKPRRDRGAGRRRRRPGLPLPQDASDRARPQ